MLRKTTQRTNTTVTRTFRVYDEQNQLLGEYSNIEAVKEAHQISCNTPIYKSIREDVYFKPFRKAENKIKVEYTKTKITEKTKKIIPFVLNETEIENIQNLPGEEWRVIDGFGGYYSCSNKGRFKITDTEGNEKLLKPLNSVNKTGRIYSDLVLNPVNDDGTIGKAVRYRTSRVLAKTWIDNTLQLSWKDDKRDVDHRDNNSENENIENLRVCSHSDNIKFAIYEQGKDVGMPSKKCYAYNTKTKELRDYPSTAELCKDIWNKSNPGYFHTSYTHKSTSKEGWIVGYDIEELKNRG